MLITIYLIFFYFDFVFRYLINFKNETQWEI